MARFVRPSTTESMVALWVTAALDTVLFFTLCMVLLPWLAVRLLPQPLPVPPWVRMGAAPLLVVGGLALWLTCVDVFRRRGRGTPFPLDAPRRLVTTGPFAILRNPIVVGDAAVVWGEALYLACVGPLLYAVLFTFVGHVMVVYFEEPELRARFGEEYDAYCRRVPRWMPRPLFVSPSKDASR